MKKNFYINCNSYHNREEYLKDLYKSLKNQTYKNFEWVVGNDGSQDGTDKLIKSFIKEKKIKIKYVSSNIRIGKTKIDNIIIHLAKGNINAIVDQMIILNQVLLKIWLNYYQQSQKNMEINLVE